MCSNDAPHLTGLGSTTSLCLVFLKLSMFQKLSMFLFKAEHAGVLEGGGEQASCLVAKQAMEFPQVLTSIL